MIPVFGRRLVLLVGSPLQKLGGLGTVLRFFSSRKICGVLEIASTLLIRGVIAVVHCLLQFIIIIYSGFILVQLIKPSS